MVGVKCDTEKKIGLFMVQDDFKQLSMDSWRVFRIISEFVDGVETMTDLGPSVSVFGSARTEPNSKYYEMGVEMARRVAEKGFAIITGGGQGLMEAANKGARDAGGKSCGLGIDLPYEIEQNPYVDQKYSLNFRYFFIRKVMFMRYAQAYVVLPGGFGTLDEFFEALTLIQTKKTSFFPVYLMGVDYWSDLIHWLKNTTLENQMISKEDLDLWTLTDDPEEVANGIEKNYKNRKNRRNF